MNQSKRPWQTGWEGVKRATTSCLHYWPFYVVMLSVLAFCVRYAPLTLTADRYYKLVDQWSPVLAIKLNIIAKCLSLFLPFDTEPILPHLLSLWGLMGIFILGLGLLLLCKALDKSSKYYRLFVFLLPLLILPRIMMLQTVRVDIMLCVNLVFLLGLSSYFVSRNIRNTWALIVLLVLAINAVTYRSNAIVLLPILVFYLFHFYRPSVGRLKKLLLSFLMIVFVLGIQAIMPVKKSYPLSILMKSDIKCTNLIVNNDLASKDVFFPIYWDHSRDGMSSIELKKYAQTTKSDWINIIKDHPQEFINARAITYNQFLFIGILPDSVRAFINHCYIGIRLPMTGTFALTYRKQAEQQSHLTHYELDQKYTMGSFNSLQWQTWIGWQTWLLSRLIFTINIISILTACILFSRRKHIKSPVLQYIMWSSIICSVYLLSFAVATPTPDIRYHITNLILGAINIDLLIIWAILQINTYLFKKHHQQIKG